MVKRESVRELIGAYSPAAFADVVKAACAPATFVAASRVIRLGGGLPDATVLGVVRDLPGENGLAAPLLVADVTLDAKTLTERSSRILQFKVARKVLEQVCVNPPVPVEGIIVQGVFAFHGDGGAFRISLVTAKAEDGKLVWSQVRRQSFYVENNPEQNATFIQRMTMNWSSLAAIREAFSVEKLTKEFYSQLFKWYERACEDERVEYPNDLATDKDNREDKNRKHLLRLITRLMFVWFLKKKGLVPELFFDEKALKGILKDFNPVSRKQHQYYRAILQNLFFATLNSEIGERGFAETPTPNRKGEKATTKHHGVKTKYRYADEFAISRKEVVERFRPIPFLNGGLFECLDQEGEDGKVMYYDGFSLQEFHRDNGTLTWAHVPNDLFFDEEYGIIPLLKRYNFTVEENTPGDEDVALDPELLGKVFENLLGAYNPETEEVVRKSTGSFYTPREIVNYMVDESLIAYLEEKVDGRGERPARPQSGSNENALGHDCGGRGATALPGKGGRARSPSAPQSGNNENALGHDCGGQGLTALPGKGGRARSPSAPQSGDNENALGGDCGGQGLTALPGNDGRARPPSAIRALVKDGIRPDDAALCKKLIAAIEGAKILDPACGSGAFPMGALLKMTELLRILKKLPEDANLYDLKLKLIEHCIFGVDIQEIAVQISKLRFFISLVCEQEPDWNKPDYGIETLPNLETKFVAANSLIGLKRTDAKDGDTSLQQTDLFFDSGEIAKIKEDLWEVRHKHFLAKTRKEKNALRREDKELRTKLAKRGKELGYSDDATRLMASWDPYNQNVHADFFDPAWMFNVKDGFDVVIGNPPYVQLQANGGELAKLYQGCKFETFDRTGDLYCLFYEQGWRLLNATGNLCYITSDKWMRNDYGKSLRQFFLTQTDCRILIDITGQQVFESAVVETNILLFGRKNIGKCEPLALDAKMPISSSMSILSSLLTPCAFESSQSWAILSSVEYGLKQKIESIGTRLKEWDVSINLGVKTGLNPAFVIDDDTRADLISRDRNAARIIKPVLRGRDVQRYAVNQQMWLLDMHNGVREKGIKRVCVSDYPSIKLHLEQFKKDLAKRGDKGDTSYNLRDCAYWEDLGKDKIIWGELSDNAKFVLSKCYLLNTCFFMVGKSLPYILGLLNSQLIAWYFGFIATKSGMGTTRWYKGTVEQVPIVHASSPQQKPIIALVDKILAAKKKDPDADTSAWEREIDELVYDLYGLTEEERKIVEGGSRGARALPTKGGRARSPSAPQSGDNENALAGDCVSPEAKPSLRSKSLEVCGHGATALPAKAKKPRAPKFEEEF